MQVAGGRFVCSPSDLNQFLECEHLIQLEQQRDRRIPRPPRDAHAELLSSKGAEHEARRLQQFIADGHRVVTIARSETERDWAAEAAQTVAAMHDGADVIYQGVFADGDWHGVSDFLVRIDEPSALGSWSYEAWDTKLARRNKPYFVLQLCFYSEQIARIQRRSPDSMVVVLGTGREERLRVRDFDAYYRAVRRRFVTAAGEPGETYPYPVAHCSLCEYDGQCRARRQADDHLSLVAGITRSQVERLQDAGIMTVSGLAAASLEGMPMATAVSERLRHQAQLQDGVRRSGVHRYDLLPASERNGFRLLPKPSPGDIFFDMEGDPYYAPARGLEYLFGAVTVSPGNERQFTAFRALTIDEEKQAFEQFIDFVQARLREYPDLHVYHYAPYETTALKRLMSEHGTREEELDDLLRREVFVDLYQVVRQSLRMSFASYSIKKVRHFFMADAGQGRVADGGDSILEFERWRATGDPAILEAIEQYNEEDCLSTLLLRDWLVDRKVDVERRDDVTIDWKPVEPVIERPERIEEDAVTRDRRERLVLPGTGAGQRLLADLLNYHRREQKPAYWAFFERRKKSMESLLQDTEAIAGLTAAAEEPPRTVLRSLEYALDFPPQEFKLSPGQQVEDPFRAAAAGTISRIDAERGRLWLKRGVKRDGEPLPSAIVAPRPHDTAVQRKALGRVADAFIAADGPRYGAARDLLERAAPRLRNRVRGASLQTLDLDEQTSLVAALDDSYLVVQGPPGSGKTYGAARIIVSLLASGKRIGVAANSHKAVNNLLEEIERVALSRQVSFVGVKKNSDDDDALGGSCIEDTTDNARCESADVRLIGGTSFLFARAEMDHVLDYLFIDEAGQVALADAVAMSAAARNLVLIGDPQQLPQVRQGIHPEGAGCSVLEHLLNGHSTVPADRGIFLARSWRMHPSICDFVSELSYERRLFSAEGRERQRVESSGLAGSGLRYVAVTHEGNAQQSDEEAAVVAREVRMLLADGRVIDHDGQARPMSPADILVVAPYNMQVRTLRAALPTGVAVGTVDRFQGREAAVVLFSMASSTGEDVPRGLEFLFSRNRFNVAISRAKAMAVVVSSPRLLETRCRSVEQMRLVNALCAFAEQAGRGPDGQHVQ